MIPWALKREIRSLRMKHVRDFFLQVAEIVVPFFTHTYKACISWTDWSIDLIFCMVPSYDLVYWWVKFQDISDSATTGTSLPSQKFQISVAKKIFNKIFLNFALTTLQRLDKSWVSCMAIIQILDTVIAKNIFFTLSKTWIYGIFSCGH